MDEEITNNYYVIESKESESEVDYKLNTLSYDLVGKPDLAVVNNYHQGGGRGAYCLIRNKQRTNSWHDEQELITVSSAARYAPLFTTEFFFSLFRSNPGDYYAFPKFIEGLVKESIKELFDENANKICEVLKIQTLQAELLKESQRKISQAQMDFIDYMKEERNNFLKLKMIDNINFEIVECDTPEKFINKRGKFDAEKYAKYVYEQRGFEVKKTISSRWRSLFSSRKGIPDFVVTKEQNIFFVEVKGENDGLHFHQMKIISESQKYQFVICMVKKKNTVEEDIKCDNQLNSQEA